MKPNDFFDGLACSSCGHAHPKMTCAGFAAGLQSDSIAPSAKEAKGPWSPTTGGSTGDPHEFCFGRKIDVARMCGEHRKLLVKVPPETAVKHDDGKPDYTLIPKELLDGSARAYVFGEKKYARFNYRNGDGLKVSRNARATIGHVLAWLHGEENDPESGLCHLDHAAAALGMLMDTYARVRAGKLPAETDNRWKENEQ